MYLVCGLGNPGSKYFSTRHNIGFRVVDELCQRHNLGPPKEEHYSQTFKLQHKGQVALLAKPQTFMNLSGESILSLTQFYKIPLERLFVIHDEVDLDFFTVKVQQGRSPGGHNGIKSIHERMGTSDYGRLRMGIGRPPRPGPEVSDFVLQSFTKEEASHLPEFLRLGADIVECFIERGLQGAANRYNGFKPPAEKENT